MPRTITNLFGLPSSIYNALAHDSYTSTGDISITRLISPPRIVALRRHHENEIVEDASERVWSLLGSSVHSMMEKSIPETGFEKSQRLVRELELDMQDRWDLPNEEEIASALEQIKLAYEIGEGFATIPKPIKIEKRLDMPIDGLRNPDTEEPWVWTLSGQPDIYEEDTISDYKVTCLPMDAQALTRSGWKFRSELLIGEEILAYDPDTDTTKWTPLLDIVVDRNALTVSMKSKSFHMECTPNHGWFVQFRSSDQRYHARRTETKDLMTHERIICAAPCYDETDNLVNEREAELIGWIFTDGHLSSGRYFRAQIYQSKEPYRTEIEEKFSDYIVSKKVRQLGNSKPITTFHLSAKKTRVLLERCGIKKSKDLPRFVTRISNRCRLAMLSAMWKAEGTIKSSYKRMLWCQNRGHVSDAFQILNTLCGNRMGLGCKHPLGAWYLSVLRTRYASATLHHSKDNVSKTLWTPSKTQDVWCPVTKYNSFVTRWRRQITITGNSVFSFLLGDKPEWTNQLNLQAMLHRHHGDLVTRVRIIAILRDWSHHKARLERDYPQCAVHIVELPLWTQKMAIGYAEQRVRLHQSAWRDYVKSKFDESALPQCTNSEKWYRGSKFPVIKQGNKRADRVFDTIEEAEKYRDTNTKSLKPGKKFAPIVERPGEYIRCAKYCDIANFCSFGQKIKALKRESEEAQQNEKEVAQEESDEKEL